MYGHPFNNAVFNAVFAIKHRLWLLTCAVVYLLAYSASADAVIERPGSYLNTESPLDEYSISKQRPSLKGYLGDKLPSSDPLPRLIDSIEVRSVDVKQLLQAAEAGDIESQYRLYLSYSDGIYTSADVGKANYWLLKAAEAGHPESLNDLGVVYLEGLGLERDVDRAVSSFRRAAEKGLPLAFYNLGALYETGIGLPHSNDLAIQQYRLAAEAGESNGQMALALMLIAAQDYRDAVKWLELASNQNLPEAKFVLSLLYAAGQGTAVQSEQAMALMRQAGEMDLPGAYLWLALMLLDDSLGTPDVEQARLWLIRAVEQGLGEAAFILVTLTKGKLSHSEVSAVRLSAIDGNAHAQLSLAIALLVNTGSLDENAIGDAVEWVERSATQGLAAAQEVLGQFHEFGLGVARDQTEADRWYANAVESYRLLANSNDYFSTHSKYRLALLMRSGRGGERNLEESVFWLTEAAGDGLMEARFDLAVAYLTGEGVDLDAEKSFQLFTELAKEGVAKAQLRLGIILMSGEALPQDIKKARHWLLRAAESGSAQVIAEVAEVFHLGTWNDPDYPQALRLYQLAADRGNAQAMNGLGVMLKKGLGVEVDAEKAVNWYRKAAEKGSARGMNNLGYAYHKGQGVRQDIEQAIVWYQKAARLGDALAENNLANFYMDGEHLPKDVAEAVRLYECSASKGYGSAQVTLGLMYRDGRGVTKDNVRALALIEQGADNEEPRGLHALGVIYMHGSLGVGQDFDKALVLLRRALDLDYIEAAVALGAMYEQGMGVKQDYAEAMRHYRFAAESGQGMGGGQHNIGQLYMFGRGVQKDYAEAFAWHQKAAQRGLPASIRILAEMHRAGMGVPVDVDKAETLARRAAALGDASALYKLGLAFLNGDGVLTDSAKAKQLLQLAADHGHVEAAEQLVMGNQSLVATVLDSRNIDIELFEQSSEYFDVNSLNRIRQAAIAGDPGSMCLYAKRIADDIGVVGDEQAMWHWYHKAAEAGDSDCQMRLAIFYAIGGGVEKDRNKARELFEAAVNQMNSEAYHNFAFFHTTGPQSERDYVGAYKWYWLAAESGRTDSAQMRKKLEKLLSKPQVKQGQQEALDWLRSRGVSP